MVNYWLDSIDAVLTPLPSPFPSSIFPAYILEVKGVNKPTVYALVYICVCLTEFGKHWISKNF